MVSYFCMQTSLDQERIVALGAEEKCVGVVGNVKFDMSSEEKSVSREALGFDKTHEILIAGSTHPGEEEIVLDMYQTLRAEFPALRIIMSPRHIERTAEVVALIKGKGLNPCKFSELKTKGITSQDVIVVDTIGHLKSLYSLAKIVFVGKSLIGGGGQNIIEPAFFAKPIVVGPNMDNFKDIMDLFLAEKAIIQVQNSAELLLEIRRLLKNPESLKTIGLAAQKVLEKHQGASEKTMRLISRLIPNIS